MTHDHPMPDDELVSAVLDGEATADEVARVEGDPALRARLAELRAAAAAVAAPVDPLPADVVDDVVARALAGAAADAPPSTTAAPAPPDELAARRRRRTGWLVAAAAAIVALIGIPLALSADDDGPTQFAAVGSAVSGDERATAEAAPDALADRFDDAELEGSDGAGAAAPTTTAPMAGAPDAPEAATDTAEVDAPLPAAGDVRTPDDLRRWAADVGLPAVTTSTDELARATAALAVPGTGASPACLGQAPEALAGWAAATSGGGAAEVWVVGRAVAPDEVLTVVVLVDATTCATATSAVLAEG